MNNMITKKCVQFLIHWKCKLYQSMHMFVHSLNTIEWNWFKLRWTVDNIIGVSYIVICLLTFNNYGHEIVP